VVVKTAVAIGLLAQVKELVVHHVLHTTQIVRHTVAMTVRRAPMTAVVAHHLVVAAMIVTRVQHVVTMNVNLVLLETAMNVQHVQVLVVASATATVLSVLHTVSQIQLVSKTALQSAVGLKIAVAIHLAKSATQTVRTVQHAMIHANHHSAVHATQTQTRRLSSRTRFLSV
jgi:hypothetical protein